MKYLPCTGSCWTRRYREVLSESSFGLGRTLGGLKYTRYDTDQQYDKDKDKDKYKDIAAQVRDQEWAAEGAITILPKRANINGSFNHCHLFHDNIDRYCNIYQYLYQYSI